MHIHVYIRVHVVDKKADVYILNRNDSTISLCEMPDVYTDVKSAFFVV